MAKSSRGATMPADYRLTYFNIRGKAEICRLIFAAAGVQYEDVRHDYASWKGSPPMDVKGALPFGQLPTLTVDGAVYCQSIAIARYLAETFGLAGKTYQEKLRADMIALCVEDVLKKIVITRLVLDPSDKSKAEERASGSKETLPLVDRILGPLQEKLAKKFREEQLPESCCYLERLLEENHGGNGYLIGESLTWADITLYHHLTSYVPMAGVQPADFLDAYPKLKGLVERVGANPGIAAWVAKRPISDF